MLQTLDLFPVGVVDSPLFTDDAVGCIDRDGNSKVLRAMGNM